MDLDLPPKPSREPPFAMCRDEPEKAAELILLLWEKVEPLAATVEKQGPKIAVLEAKLAKNSSNSSKPPHALLKTLRQEGRNRLWGTRP